MHVASFVGYQNLHFPRRNSLKFALRALLKRFSKLCGKSGKRRSPGFPCFPRFVRSSAAPPPLNRLKANLVSPALLAEHHNTALRLLVSGCCNSSPARLTSLLCLSQGSKKEENIIRFKFRSYYCNCFPPLSSLPSLLTGVVPISKIGLSSIR